MKRLIALVMLCVLLVSLTACDVPEYEGKADDDTVSTQTQDTTNDESEVASGYKPGVWTANSYTSEWLNLKFEKTGVFKTTEDYIKITQEYNEALKLDDPNASTTEMEFYSQDYFSNSRNKEYISIVLYVEPITDESKTLEDYANEDLKGITDVYEKYDIAYTLLENENQYVEFLGGTWLLHHNKIFTSEMNEEYSFYKIKDNYLVELSICAPEILMNLSYILTGFSALHGSAGGDIVSIPTQDTVKNESEVVSGYQPGTWTVNGYTSQWLNMKFEARSAFEITEDRIESTTKKNEAKKQDNPNAQTTEMVFYSLDYKYYYEDSEVIGLYVQPVVDKNKTLEAYADENLQSSFHIYEEYDNEYTLLENTNSHVEFLGQSWLLHHHKILDSDLNSVDEEYSFFRIQDNYLVQLMILGSGETTYQMDLRDILTCFSALNGAGQANNTQSPLICSHDYTEATCLKPQTCTICGDTIGSALEHQWENATCETPETCNRCGATTGDAAGHKWKSATCTEPERCTVCEETGAEAQGHSMLFTKCSRSSCDYIDYSCIAGTYTNIGGYGVPVGTTKMVDIDVTNVSVSNSGELSFTYNGKNYTLTVKQNNKGDKFMMYFDCYLDGVLVDNVNFRAGNELYDNRIYLGEFIADGCAIYLNATK